jgi:metalloendopeptidase OMA1, mitochondrial
MKIQVALFAGCLLLVASCTGPITQSPTGRNQLMIFSEAEINAAAETEYAQVKASSRLITSGPRYAAVQRVGRAVADHAARPEYQWEFILIDQDTVVNAWCMPGGKVAVYTGLLPVARDEGGLAAVTAHEIGHVMAQHSNERASYGAVQDILGDQVARSTAGSKYSQAWMAVFGVGSTLGFILPYSRTQESEADEIGIMMMARAGYDPHAAAELWDRMAASGRSGVPLFLSTHPDPAARAAALRKLLPAAMSEYEVAPTRRAATQLP